MALVKTNLAVGYGNMYGGYTLSDKSWGSRISAQVALVQSLAVDLFFPVELHEENSADLPEGGHRLFLAALQVSDPDWALGIGGGGNHCLYRPSLFSCLAANTYRMPGSRNMSDFWLRSSTTGVDFNVVNAHFRADDSNGTSRATERAQQGQFVVDYMASNVARGFFVGDFNSYTYTAGYPRAIFAAAGWGGLKDRSSPLNAGLSSHSGDSLGRWIEDIETRTTETILSSAMVPTNGASDHWGWMRANLTLAPAEPMTPNAAGTPAGISTLTHGLHLAGAIA